MNKKLFSDLTKSIKQAGRIRRGERPASRTYTYDAVDVRTLRESVQVSQSQFARVLI
ncbi:hypothetical protein [Anaerobaca lacustris]|uniref:Transcriptional regulator n=1 Tax=Anaerobaca lacustris TaxID=3044600 RepID=A0AAW6U2D6_9BACT|nr:hypothetical protein [Sedimentisphaerales bacterium M17dextr]